MKEISGGITAAKGFAAVAVEAGIKYSNRKDLALIYSESPCHGAGTFTTNVVKAAPVLWDQEIIEKKGMIHAIVINSGYANACTGSQGMETCSAEAEYTAECLSILKDSVLVASTGEIGKQIPLEKLKEGIKKASKSFGTDLLAGEEAAKAIMTTDTVHKQVAVTFTIGGKEVTMGGMCKGSGMIHPNMCTMLSFITCDIAISKELLRKAVKEDVKDTYNMISVDGDTSTNDTLLVLTNGLAGNAEILEENEDYESFCEALNYVNTKLAKKMAGDGEGATALFEVTVYNAGSKEDGRTLAKSVICSSLTKAAIFGHDANWGRILCALGYSGVEFDPCNLDLYFKGKNKKIHIYGEGVAKDYSEEEASKILSEEEVCVEVDMHMGTERATAWGCDLSYDYVKINADYRS
ncbi:bifunctional glutamate N-acetyltransferase/amino-acid acetyltransferase ArgJ [Lachnospiraceae bacterium OttesenSCG-928-D06]|nr:bifunctional glutamate N-acetyltransferase/amino-acid acetyltransferase ArgJ [Lachnospiraceae bacterium OttesenSCG-928-D06]